MTQANLTQLVNPNFIYLLPEMIVVGTMLIVMVLDLYIKEKRVLVWATLGGVLLALAGVYFSATNPDVVKAIGNGTPPEYFGKMLIADNFTFFMKGVLLGVVALVTLLSVDYVEKFLRGMYVEFYEVMLAATLGMIFMISSRDIIMIYVGLELSSISSYILAGLLRHDAKSNESALKYFLNGALASAILLFGVSLIYGVTGSTYLPEIAAALAPGGGAITHNMPLIVTGILFLVGGFAFKVAAAPMHLWAPDAYEGAPTPVTAFFSVGPKGAAFGAILRVFLIGLGATQLLNRWALVWAILATASMFIGNLTALVQTNVKRMMAYSSIAQAGYILVGVVAAGYLGKDGYSYGTSAVLFYVMSYAVTNLGIFAVLTHLDQEGGWVTVSDFNGLSQRNPFYAWALMFSFVSLIGIPPTAGFMGKWLLIQAAWNSPYWWLALVIAVNSVISVGYYYGIVKAMFLEKPERESLPVSGSIMTTVVLSFVGVLLVGLLANPFIEITRAAAALLK